MYSVVIFHFLVLWDCRVQHLFESRVALNPGLGGVRHLILFLMNRLNKTESAVFKLWMP